jgi:hypothetical protein
MTRLGKGLLFSFLALVIIIVGGITFTIGWRPFFGPNRSFAIRVEKELKYFVFSKRTQKVGTTDWAAARDRDGGWSLMRGGGC